MMPWVIEYSFVRARSRFMTDEDASQRVDDVVRG